MVKMHFKKFLILMLALAVTVTGLPLSSLSGVEEADAVSIAKTGSMHSDDLGSYKMNLSKYMQIYWVDYEKKELKDNGSCTEANMPMKKYTIGDTLVFCVEHGVTQKNTTKMGARVWNNSEIYEAYTADKKGYAINNIFSVLFYGPVEEKTKTELEDDLGFKKSTFYGNNASSYSTTDWIAATQMLVWECQQLMRDEKFNLRSNGLYYTTGYQSTVTKGKIGKEHYYKKIKGTAAQDIYDFMESEIKKNLRFDTSVAKSTATEAQSDPISIPENATYPYKTELKATGTIGSKLKVVDEKGKKVEGITIEYKSKVENGKTKYYYELTIDNKNLVDSSKTYQVKHDNAAAARAEKYTKGDNKSKYNKYFWGYATQGGKSHTQGFVSGLDDPTTGYFVLSSGVPPTQPKEGECKAPDVDVFPTVYMPIKKIDANEGWDGDPTTPMGDAALDAVVTLERKIGSGAWETIDTKQFDELGSEMTFLDQPFKDASDLKSYMTNSEQKVTGCGHKDSPHSGSKDYQHTWNVEVDYRITVTRPDGRYIDPDQFAGVREYKFTYNAETHDKCSYYCDSDPWTDVNYTFNWSVTKGAGTAHSLEGTKETVKEAPDLYFDLETDKEDCFRGSLLLIKSNEKENTFKDSALGGSDNNISKQTKWTIRLKSGGYENNEYIKLVSNNGKLTPSKGTGGTNIYTVSRDDDGITNSTDNPLVVGSNGQLIVKDLPYGEYIVEEVKTDDPMYVNEQFTVVVSEHNGDGTGKAITDEEGNELKDENGKTIINDGSTRVQQGTTGAVPLTGKWGDKTEGTGYYKSGTSETGLAANGTGDYYNNLYQVNLRDKVKSNQIQLQKVDSETGKIVRMSGTKVFIRYKGNPDYTDEQNQARYGANGTVAKNTYNRFLPNAESINSASTNYTFELDENGIIDIPYELPYGEYEIYEWLLPEGYYVGEYDAKGNASSHNFGLIDEGKWDVDENLQRTADTSDNFKATTPYAIKDSNGNIIEYKDKTQYKFDELKNMITNRYTFTVTKQNLHVDGNYSELVTYTGYRESADPTYQKSDYPYEKYYKVAAVINNAVKGKITIEKEGETLTGFKKVIEDGKTLLQPVYDYGVKLKNAVFGIFAAEDINLNDGSEGPKIYDSETGEEITLTKKISTHLNNAAETVKAFIDKLNPAKEYNSESNYDVSEYSHNSGAELWQMLERGVSTDNIKRTIYVTPEQKDTVYKYAYETSDDTYNYRYDVEVTLQNQADGTNVTGVVVTKTTSVKDGYVTDITGDITNMMGTVGNTTLNPLESYMDIPDGAATGVDPNLISALDSAANTYVYEATGDIGLDYADKTTDFSDIGASRRTVENYRYYTLTANDLKDVEKVVKAKGSEVAEVDDGDGVYDKEGEKAPVPAADVKQTKKQIEWDAEAADPEYEYTLVAGSKVGGKAIFKKALKDTTEYEYRYDEATQTIVKEPKNTQQTVTPTTPTTPAAPNTPPTVTEDKAKGSTTTAVSNAEGTYYTATITPQSGYTIDKVTVNGEEVTPNADNTVVNIPAGAAVTVTYKDFVYVTALTGFDKAFEKAYIDPTDATKNLDAGTVKLFSLISGSEKYKLVETEADGTELITYTIPKGFTKVDFEGDPTKDAQYVMIKGTETYTETTTDPTTQQPVTTEKTRDVYKVLLSDGVTWQDCSSTGNFVKGVVQTYEIKYTQVSGDEDGFTLNWDNIFTLGSTVEDGVATTVITNPGSLASETFDVGEGYTYTTGTTEADEQAGKVATPCVTFTTTKQDAPIYFEWKDGVKASMYYKGGVAYATIALPQSAVDYLYENVVPTLTFRAEDSEGNTQTTKLDWYSGLTPENPKQEFSVINGLPEGCKVIATRTDSLATGGQSTYYIEIITNQTEDKPLTLTFADGYEMDIYTAQAKSENYVGVLDLHNVYKTTRYTKSDLIETITTDANGEAESDFLPLGKYIVRELSAPNGYVTDDTAYEVELSYKDQFTPIVWKNLNLKNEWFTVEIDLAKVFETAYESNEYKEGGGATFGLYTAQTLTATDKDDTLISSVPEDSLLDIIKVDENGKAKSKIKLPYGVYYVKEIATKNGYVLNDTPFYFVVGEGTAEDGKTAAATTVTSTPCVVGYDSTGKDITAEDGVGFKIVLDSYGEGTVTVQTQTRYPMPSITVDGTVYNQTEDQSVEGVTIGADKDIATATISVKDGVAKNITLPNGKTLSVTITGNTYSYTYDTNAAVTFVPTTSYTGYSGKYVSEFEPTKGEDLLTQTQEVTVTEALNTPNKVVMTITHTPVAKKVVDTPAVAGVDANKDNDYDDPGDTAPKEATYKTVGVLDSNGYQTYTHTATFSFVDNSGANAVKDSTYTRTYKDTTTNTEKTVTGTITTDPTLTPANIAVGDTIAFTSNTGANFTLKFDKDGTIKTTVIDTLTGSLTDTQKVTASVTTTVTETIKEDKTANTVTFLDSPVTKSTATEDKTADTVFAKNVTQARQDTSAKTMQIKVNTLDNLNVSGIENDAVKPDVPYVPSTPSGSSEAVRTVAKDGKTNMSVGLVEKEASIIDTVYYYNLSTSKTYKLEGTLMDKATGKAVTINGKTVTAETTFKPEKATSTIDMKFNFDARTLEGKDVVVFEKLYEVTENKDKPDEPTLTPVASHEDINDEGQTIEYPKLGTQAQNAENGTKTVEAAKNIVIKDTVSYANLVPGKTYTVAGYLMDKTTRKAVYDENGEKVRGITTFTAEKESGQVEVIFNVDTTKLGGKNLVVYEVLYYNGKIIGQHKDFNDEGQTIKVKKKTPDEPANPDKPDKPNQPANTVIPKTGDSSDFLKYLLLLITAASGLAACGVRTRRKEKE